MIDLGISKFDGPVRLMLGKANRHGLVTGATGTGKTVTLQRLTEEFSRAGVPVFAADIKGDLSGIAAYGDSAGKAAQRAADMGGRFVADRFPTRFLDVFGDHGARVQTSVQEMGPVLLSRMLKLNDTQAGALAIAFKISEDGAAWMLTLDDLRWTLSDMLDNREEVSLKYGNITAASINTIQRQLMALEAQGGHNLFGEPAFDITSLLATDASGRGVVTLLHADTLMEAPRLYGMLLFWMLTMLFRKLPEVGDIEKPKLVFFFDEAHLLFKEAPKELLEQIERLVRLIRSKGVGVYFVTQAVSDVPETVLAQLGNRVQHAVRAFTPSEQRMVKAAVRAFRPREGIDVAALITTMGVGEALVSFLDTNGTPEPVQHVRIIPPCGQIGPISALERDALLADQNVTETRITQPQQAHAFENRMRAANGFEQKAEGIDTTDLGLYRKYLPAMASDAYDAPRGQLFGLICAVLVGGAVFWAMV